MKKPSILCLVLLYATLMQAQNVSYNIDYSYESFSGCNIFSSSKTVDNFKHESTVGFPSFIANPDYLIVLPCKEVPPSDVLGTEYQVQFPFKKGFRYQVNVQYKGSGGAGTGNGQGYPTLALKLNESVKPINSSTACNGPKAIPTTEYWAAVISGQSLAWPQSPILNTVPLDKDYQSLTLASLPSSQQTNQLNIYIRAISIVELPPVSKLLHYTFNNNYNDISGNNLNGQDVGTSFTKEGKDIGAVRFNGTSSYIKVPVSDKILLNSDKLTLSTWIKPATLQGTQTITSSQNSDGYTNGWRLIMLNGTLNGRVTTTAGSADVYAAGIQAGVWNHVVMVYDSKQLKLYINGVFRSAVPIEGNIVNGNYEANMLIGNSRGSNYYFNGQMDDFKFYIGDLTADEILADYNNSKDDINYPHAFIAYYKFNNNWLDNSGNNLTISPYYSSFACGGADAISAGFYGNSILTVPQSPKFYPSTEKFYVSCWIKPSNVQGIKALAHSQNGDGYNQGWRMLLLDNAFNGRIVTSQGGADVYISGIQANVWTHVGMSYDGNSLKGYLNGNLVTSTAIGGYMLTGATANMRLGYSNGNNYYYSGLIDEFRFYDGNMSAQQILQDYQEIKNAIENPPPCPLRMFEHGITRHK